MKLNNKILFVTILGMLFSITALGVEIVVEEKEGVVTFISSQYVYVKFNDMNGIEQGDTLYIKNGTNLLPVLIIEHISSTSSACVYISNYEIKVNDAVFAKVEIRVEKEEITEDINAQPEVIPTQQPVTRSTVTKRTNEKSGISGRATVQSHSNFSNNSSSTDYQRWRYTLLFNADKISGSDLSFSSYVNFNYRADRWSEATSDIWKSLKIYDLAFKYEIDNSFNLTAGRSRNRKISNIGSIDGLQAEKRFKDFYTGLVVGSRPDFTDLSVNLKLFEFGGYIGRTDTTGSGVMENNVAFIQQTNNFKIDRRFVYFQHSNNILDNTSFFLSSEIDLYKKILGVESTELTLTGLFLSARYSPVRFFSASVSYDARKRVVYYETHKNFIDSLFENETRQGLNFRTSLRPMNNLLIGLSAGYRFMNKDIKPTRNFGGSISYSMIPFIESSASLSYTKLITNYTEGTTAGLRIAKALFDNKVDLSFGYRRSEYEFSNTNKISQNSVTIDLSGRFTRQISFTIGYEGIFVRNRTSGRVLVDISTRF